MIEFLEISSQRIRQLGIGCIVIGMLLIGLTIKNEWTFWRGGLVIFQQKSQPFQLVSAQPFSRYAISDWHLFGVALPDHAALPGTQLQIELNGILTATPQQFSQAIISVMSQPSHIYHVGESLLGMNVRIHSITREGVILDNGGHLEKLSLQRAVLIFQGLPKSVGG